MTREEYLKIRDEKKTKIDRLSIWQYVVFAIGVSLLIISAFILFGDDSNTFGWLLFCISGVPMLGVECILNDAIKQYLKEWQDAFYEYKDSDDFWRDLTC